MSEYLIPRKVRLGATTGSVIYREAATDDVLAIARSVAAGQTEFPVQT